MEGGEGREGGVWVRWIERGRDGKQRGWGGRQGNDGGRVWGERDWRRGRMRKRYYSSNTRCSVIMGTMVVMLGGRGHHRSVQSHSKDHPTAYYYGFYTMVTDTYTVCCLKAVL